MVYSNNVNPAACQLLKSAIFEDELKMIDVLEFGCWTGALGSYWLNTFPNQINSWTGIEYNNEAANIAQTQLTKVYNYDLNTINLNLLDKSLLDFNVIIMVDVLEHLFSPRTFLEHLRSQINSIQRIIIILPNIGCHQILELLQKQQFDYTESGILDKTHVYHFTLKSFTKLISNIGYRIVCEPVYLRNEEGDRLFKNLLQSQNLSTPNKISENLFVNTNTLLDLKTLSSYGFGVTIAKC